MCFNPRTHTGCDVSLAWLVTGSGVSIHAPTRGATDNNEDNSFLGEFQSTHPHGVRRHTKTIINKGIKSFNPRTHTGCDKSFSAAQAFLLVSIHAPTRGATAQGVRESNGQGVSIHAPTRGATPLYFSIIQAVVFQSTHPHGVRLSAPLAVPLPLTVSIHAPTRGATWPRQCISRYGRFNPRTHTGCDDLFELFFFILAVSIHAPTRGATKTDKEIRMYCLVSIHAPTRGATPLRCPFGTLTRCFNPRTHTGCDASPAYIADVYIVSIHAPTRGATGN